MEKYVSGNGGRYGYNTRYHNENVFALFYM